MKKVIEENLCYDSAKMIGNMGKNKYKLNKTDMKKTIVAEEEIEKKQLILERILVIFIINEFSMRGQLKGLDEEKIGYSIPLN